MRRADEAAISAGTPAEVLMERAGRAVARRVLRETGGRYGRKVTIVCGKGNNGGDGFVVARVLHQEGVRVTCCATFDPAEARGAARHHLDLLRTAGCRVVPFAERHLHADVIVDAVFGTGFHGEAKGEVEAALYAIEHVIRGEDLVDEDGDTVAAPPAWSRPRVVAIDVPSAGLVPADVIVALGAEKLETFFSEPDEPAAVEVADIGISLQEARVWALGRDDVMPSLPELRPGDHKTSHGAVLVIAGSDTTTGAALLTARSAARMGAGYVTLASTPHVIHAANVRLPEILKKKFAAEPVIGPAALNEMGGELERADAVALGPGLGTGDAQTALVERCLREVDKPLVLDADALNALAGRGDLISARGGPCVVTPHAAEMGRLLGIETADVLRDRVGAALRAADEFGCVVVLKGHRTVVAAPGEGGGSAIAWAVPVGGPELATAGTGDVLTGAIAATLARGTAPHEGAAMACYVHGIAGAVAADGVGPTGVLAWDVAEAIPAAVQSLRAPYAG